MIAAIYSRKSVFTGKGESIENQIELCKEYGERLGVKDYLVYEDEGFSGGNTNRPKFQELIKDAKNKKFDVLICYRLDRISRNVADFSATLEILQDNNIDFVSIREQFDTSTPMGRAMVYISSVFAQLERETIAERVRDNMLQLAKTGRWLGGQEPFGYASERVTYIDEELKERSLMKLIPIPEELEIILLIYNKYLELHSITQVVKYLNLAGIKGKNGGEWASMQVKRILSNPLYVKSSKEVENYLKGLGINVFGDPKGQGYLTYNKTKSITKEREMTEWIAAVAKHQGIIEPDRWIEVQKTLEDNKDKKLPRLGTGDTTALLPGILKCSKCKSNMRIKQGHSSRTEENLRYDYYVCGSKNDSYGQKCNNKNIRVDRLDKIVLNEVKAYSKDFLVNELSAAIKNEVDTNPFQNKIETINDEITEKEKAMSNLVKQLSLNNNEQVGKYIFAEMERINNELSALKKDLELAESNDINLNSQIDNTNIILDALTHFNTEFDMLDNIQLKRTLLKTVVDEVLWDGDNDTVKVIFSMDDKKK